MRVLTSIMLMSSAVQAFAANIDGPIDPDFGTNLGRGVLKHPESNDVQTRAVLRDPSSGTHWLIGTDPNDAASVYFARLTSAGLPDPGFGGGDGLLRSFVPLNIFPQSESIEINGAVRQNNGLNLIYGAMRRTHGQSGAFPGFVCRYAASGTITPSFDADGCQLLRSQLAADEDCEVTDVAVAAFDYLVLVGNCTAPSIGERPFIARLTDSGAFDIEFNGGIGMVLPAPPHISVSAQHYSSVVAIPDGRIAVLGEYLYASNNFIDFELGISRFDNGGGADPSFNNTGWVPLSFDLGGDNHDRARDLVLRPDGRLLALGEARRIDTQRTVALLAQVLDSGQPDLNFGPGGKRSDDIDGLLTHNAQLVSLELDSLGRPVIGGSDVAIDERANPNGGRSFHFGFIPTLPPYEDAYLRITSATATSGTVSSPVLAQPIQFSVTPGAVTLVTLPVDVHNIGSNDAVLSRAVTIESLADINVIALSGRDYTSANTVLTPDTGLGRNYRLMSWQYGLGMGSMFAVAATQANTTVTITTSVDAGAHVAGVPFQVVLQPGQVFQLGDPTADMTGTMIEANKPVAVIAGNTTAQVPDEGQGNSDESYEQQIPIERWGTHFFAVPPANRTAGVVVRILANRTPTKVWFDGVVAATLDAGEFHDAVRTTATAIVTSHPASVAQFDMSCGVDSPNPPPCFGDATQLTLEPVSRWGFNYHATIARTFSDTAPTEHRIRIIAPSSVVGTLTVDGVALAANAFSAIGNSGHAVAQIVRSPGFHQVQATQPISVSVYASSEQEATAHNAAIVGIRPNADDLVLRLNANGSRDASFGSNGVTLINHSALANSQLHSQERLVRAIPLYDSILVGTSFLDPVSNETKSVAYHLIGGGLFKDEFE